MKFATAKKLRNGDEVLVKETGEILSVVGEVTVSDKTVLIPCNDGNIYTHKEVV